VCKLLKSEWLHVSPFLDGHPDRKSDKVLWPRLVMLTAVALRDDSRVPGISMTG
jgi:hypothetical protein